MRYYNIFSGSRISLISKNNIRYEGTLYSINEADAQVALQNVKSFGTEGRELLDTTGTSTYVPPNDVVHAYLLFRGQDIKDLHVHEKATNDVGPPAKTTTTAAEVASSNPPTTTTTTTQPASTRAAAIATAQGGSKPTDNKQTVVSDKLNGDNTRGAPDKKDAPSKATRNSASTNAGNSSNNSGANKEPRKTSSSTSNAGTARKNQNMVGTGASLLNRKARGAKGSQGVCMYVMYYVPD